MGVLFFHPFAQYSCCWWQTLGGRHCIPSQLDWVLQQARAWCGREHLLPHKTKGLGYAPSHWVRFSICIADTGIIITTRNNFEMPDLCRITGLGNMECKALEHQPCIERLPVKMEWCRITQSKATLEEGRDEPVGKLSGRATGIPAWYKKWFDSGRQHEKARCSLAWLEGIHFELCWVVGVFEAQTKLEYKVGPSLACAGRILKSLLGKSGTMVSKTRSVSVFTPSLLASQAFVKAMEQAAKNVFGNKPNYCSGLCCQRELSFHLCSAGWL